jgi:hypothetical protein
MIVYVRLMAITSQIFLISNAKFVIHLAYNVMDHPQKIAFHVILIIHLFCIYWILSAYLIARQKVILQTFLFKYAQNAMIHA